ncbi:MAG: hypothetical protein ACYSWP_09465 [Planctomycetota bacterium]
MRISLTILVITIVALGAFCGCNGRGYTPKTGEVFTVDFEEGKPLRYKFVSKREVKVTWGSAKGMGESPDDKSIESMEMVVRYTPIEVTPGGLSVIEAKIEPIVVERTAPKSKRLKASKDAVKSLSGKTFRFTITPNGRIEDYDELTALLKSAGEQSFRKQRGQGAKIKDADMIADFFVSQWLLWDVASSIEEPINGVEIGQSWGSQLSLPTPMLMRKARNVSYTLEEIREKPGGRIAVIAEKYSLAESVPESWPSAYPAGRFMVAGKFGMLSRYQIADFSGSGKELYNLDAGRIEKYTQKYNMTINASLIFPLPGADPKVTVKQSLSMTLLNK